MSVDIDFGGEPDRGCPFGMQESYGGDRFVVKCLGDDCKRKFASLADYAAHDCPSPDSGEAFR